jgi:hypothetical protein
MSTSKQPLAFVHQTIDPDPLGTENDVCLIGDIDGNGKNDVVIGGKTGQDNLVWYENPTWQRHVIATAHLEAGGVLVDLNGSGRLDLVAGNPMDGPNREMFWFECPADPTRRWTTHLITNHFVKYHDQAAGDVDNDGQVEILFASQESKVVGYFDVPPDPTIEPWPAECCHIIARDIDVEGLCIVDLDGDGKNEVIAGPNVFKQRADGSWSRFEFGAGFRRTRVAVADFDGDGVLDIVLSEGESRDGRLAWFKGPDWEMTLLAENLFHPHSLDVGDVNGNGWPDIFVGEMGLRGHPDPRELVFLNQGGGRFRAHVVGHLPTHDAKLGDLSGNGRLDIAGKPYHPNNQVDIWWNRTDEPR